MKNLNKKAAFKTGICMLAIIVFVVLALLFPKATFAVSLIALMLFLFIFMAHAIYTVINLNDKFKD